MNSSANGHRFGRTLYTIGVLASACGDDGAQVGSAEGTAETTDATGSSSGTTMAADTSSSEGSGSSTESTSTSAPADSSTDPGESSSTGVPNAPPIAVDDLYVVVMGQGPLDLSAELGVLANDSDPDGDAITVTAFDAASERGGTVAVTDDGAVSFTPPLDLWGADGFTYTIEDGAGGSATAHVRVMITPTTVSLGQVTAGNGGFTIIGTGIGDGAQAGWSVGGGGDVDGDGLADILVGAPSADVDGNAQGRGFVVFGKSTGENVELADIVAGVGGFVIDGDGDGDAAGHAIAHAGDVNGDGLADIIVGAPQADAIADDEGRAYVIFGKADTDPVALETLAADGAGFVIEGFGANDGVGSSVGGAVDVDGDGLDDLIVGAPLADVGAFTNAGRAWVVFGKADTDPALLSVVGGGTGGFVMNGVAAEDRAGDAVAGGGDIDGDGREDVIVGAPLANPFGGNSGRTHVVFGRTDTAAVSLSAVANGTGGFAISGIAALDQSGDAVAGGGDLNGDGLCDVVIGAYGAENDLNLQGRSFAVFGKTSGNEVLLSDIVDGIGGFVMEGEAAGDLSGWAVGGGGDLDGDGLADLLVGAQSGDYAGFLAGRSYAVHGRADTQAIDLGVVAAGEGGFAIDGELGNDVSGWSIANGGDISGDGFADVVIGAFDAPQGAGIGRAYVIFGGDFAAGVELPGTTGDDELVGTPGSETIVGGAGDDTLHSGGGFDTLYGGSGDDVIVLDAPSFFRIDGGLGTDAVAIGGGGIALDLPAYFEPAIVGIESIDLTGTGDNTLFLELRDLRALSKTSNTVVVLGDDGDSIVADLEGSGLVDLGSTDGFAMWSDGVLTLRVADAVERFVSL